MIKVQSELIGTPYKTITTELDDNRPDMAGDKLPITIQYGPAGVTILVQTPQGYSAGEVHVELYEGTLVAHLYAEGSADPTGTHKIITDPFPALDQKYDQDGRPVHTVKAEAHSDDHNSTATFDAAPWLWKATENEIIALAKCGWGGDYPADVVARDSDHPLITRLFGYLNMVNSTKTENKVGFECHVDEWDAIAWLKERRPEILEKLAHD